MKDFNLIREVIEMVKERELGGVRVGIRSSLYLPAETTVYLTPKIQISQYPTPLSPLTNRP